MRKVHLMLLAGALVLGACSQQSNTTANTQDDAGANAKANATAQTASKSDADTAANTAADTTAKTPTDTADSNPLLTQSNLFLHAPQFNKIEPGDFMPALKWAMEKHLERVREIANNPAEPTFDNTLVALEQAGQDLRRIHSIFNLLASADTNDKLQELKKEIAPMLSAHWDSIYLNDKLFKRIKAVYQKRDKLDLPPEAARLLTVVYKEFVHQGANLPKAKQARLKEINKKLSKLSATFENKLHKAIKHGGLIVSDKSKLAGFSEEQIEAAAQAAAEKGLEDKWLIPLENTTQQAALADLDKRKVRHELFMHSWKRASRGGKYDTTEIVAQMAMLRAEKADLLGFKNFAAWKLANQMVETPERVFEFVGSLVEPANQKARKEAAARQAIIDARGKDFKLKPWDWLYFGKIVRKKEYGIEMDKVKQYFALENVMKNGMFYAAHELFGLTFEKREDIPVWHEGVRVFEVHDADGSLIGLFYADYYTRDSKAGGAWMSSFQIQSHLLGTKPVVYNVANFPKPTGDKPTLLSWEQVKTMFHEFGHALHGLLSDVKYPSLAGTATARDWVEFPSQFYEHWASYPEVFTNYAVHWKTGEPMPESLVKKLRKAQYFNQGYALSELLAAALLDMRWHTIPASKKITNVEKFEKQALKSTDVSMKYVPPRYRSAYFLHLWGHAYAASYYAYLWTEMLAHDAYQWMLDHGGLTRENGKYFRKMILSRGNTEDLSEMWRDFYGRPPQIEPMLKARGID